MNIVRLVSLSGIYQVSVNGAHYVGQSRNIIDRARNHLSSLKCGINGNTKLQKAFDESKAPVQIILLEECDVDFLLERELYWIKKLQAGGFNIVNVTDAVASGISIKRELRRRDLRKTKPKRSRVKVPGFDYAKLPVQKLNIRVCYSDEP